MSDTKLVFEYFKEVNGTLDKRHDMLEFASACKSLPCRIAMLATMGSFAAALDGKQQHGMPSA